MSTTVNDENFSVSGWEDEIQDIDETRNPKGNNNKLCTLNALKYLFVDKNEYDILQACEKGNLEGIKSLIEKNPDLINITDKDKYTPLHRACYSNNIEVVKYLIQKGANISAKTEMQWEPLHSCCQWNHKECAAILIQNGADVNAKSEGSMFTILFQISITGLNKCRSLCLMVSG